MRTSVFGTDVRLLANGNPGMVRFEVDRGMDGHWYPLGAVEAGSAAQATALIARAEGTYRVRPEGTSGTYELFRVPAWGQPVPVSRI